MLNEKDKWGEEPAESLCESVFEFVKGNLDNYPVKFEPMMPEDPEGELKAENDQPRVLFIPVDLAEEIEGRGSSVLVEYSVAMLTIAPLSRRNNRRYWNRMTYQIRKSLRGVEMSLGRDLEGELRDTADYVGSSVADLYEENASSNNNYLQAVSLDYQGPDCE